MNAIVGVVGGDAPARLQRAVAALAPRLSHSAPPWRNAQVAFSGGGMETRGPLIISADARLDNRADLAAALDVPSGANDAAIVLAAYEKWGETCAEQLLGDFAFAIWDAPRAVLFCARDHFGVRPFVYANIGGAFAFASTTKAVRAAVGSDTIDEARIGDFLSGFVADRTSTLYAGIQRLAPGSTLRVCNGAVHVASYWRIPDQAEPVGADAADEFRALFQAAVRTRLTPDAGVMLSGGLDSSSIALTAARAQHLRSFSLVFANSPDERVHIDAALRDGRLEPHCIIADEHGPFDGFERTLDEQDGLFLAPGISGTRTLYAAAARAGVRVLLDGHGGDEVVSHGRGQLKVYARAGAWNDLWRYARAEANLYGGARTGVFFAYWLRFGPARQPITSALNLQARATRHLRGLMHADDPPPAWRRFVNTRFADAVDLDRRWQRARAPDFATEAEHHRDLVAAPLQAHALEALNNVSEAAGVEARYPFWDKRLVEFCLRLPPEEKIDVNGTRAILRRAMADILPPAIQQRRDKFDFTGALAASMCACNRALLDDIFLPQTSAIAPYANIAALKAAWLRVRAQPRTAAGGDVQAVWRGTALALWLNWRKRATQAPNVAAPHLEETPS